MQECKKEFLLSAKLSFIALSLSAFRIIHVELQNVKLWGQERSFLVYGIAG